jgi:C4-dicarboxylate-specific signal transduction histidine kinase
MQPNSWRVGVLFSETGVTAAVERTQRAAIRGEIAKNGMSAKTELVDSLPPVWADRVQLQQVVLNLLLNAIEAMSGMTEEAREWLIRTEQTHSDAVLVSVQDSGPGFPPESAQRLFESSYTTKPGV